jgi:hypothetical protein
MSGKDIKQKGVPIILDKERHLVYDMNAYCILEDKYGDINKAFKELESGSFHKTRWLIYVGLLHDFRENDEKMTEEDIGSYLDTTQKMNKAHSLIAIALFGSAPENDEKEVKQKSPSKKQQDAVGETVEHK